VYERTKWGDWSQPDGGSGQTDAYWKHLKGETEKEAFVSSEHSGWSNSVWIAPLYTSDYLLEKLPEWIGKYGDMQMSRGYMKGSTGAFRFFYGRDGQEASIEGTGTTAVSALLKLTIALSEAGELNKMETEL